MAKATDKKRCVGECGKERPLRDFYSTKNPMFSDGKVSICKTCIKNSFDENDIASVKNILRQLDRPYIESVWRECVNNSKETLGWYLRSVSTMNQYKDMTYDDSVSTDGATNSFAAEKHETNSRSKKTENSVNSINLSDIPLDVQIRWGEGLTALEYMQCEKLYNDMLATNKQWSVQRRQQLEQWVELTVRARKMMRIDGQEFKRLNSELINLTKSAGFEGKDIKDSAESNGIRSFGQIVAEVEKDGFIEPAPLRYDQDIIDRSILYLANYYHRQFNTAVLPVPPADTPKMDEIVGDE